MVTLTAVSPRLILFLIALLSLSASVRAQTSGSVRMSGGVSGTVALTVPQGQDVPGVRVTSTKNADHSLTVTLEGVTRRPTVVSIPVQIRSNIGYRLLVTAKSDGSDLSSLQVVRARPTGNSVFPGAAEALGVAPAFDGRGGAGGPTPASGFKRLNLSAPAELISGPRVSFGGTLLSPQNALEVTLSLAVEPLDGLQSWTVELLLSAAPSSF